MVISRTPDLDLDSCVILCLSNPLCYYWLREDSGNCIQVQAGALDMNQNLISNSASRGDKYCYPKSCTYKPQDIINAENDFIDRNVYPRGSKIRYIS